jgi:Leucine-rich repeat (LRR) protein
LEGNKLQYLHPDTFVGLPNFQSLFLAHNTGLQLPTDRQFINSNLLKHLGIYDCNINSVSVETFANASTLESLDLSYNYLRSLDINISNVLPELSELNLERNEISEIIPRTFQKNSSLEFLFLGNNYMQHLEIDIFTGLVNLKFLSLDLNKLQYLHPDMFVGLPNLKYLFLSNYPGLQISTGRHIINSHSLKLLGVSRCNISSISV